MKKAKFLMMLLASLFLSSSCSDEFKDSDSLDTSQQDRRSYAFAYKVDTSDLETTRAATLNGKTWNAGQTIRIKFLNGNTALQSKVKEVAKEWLEHAYVKFEYVNASENADVKIGFSWNNDRVTWSTIGTDAKNVPQNQPSMNLTIFNQNDLKEINSEEFSISILREFGHVLGLVYEHQVPNASFKWDELRVRTYFRQQGWSEAQINQLLTVYSTAQTNYSQFDPQSIMLLFFPEYLTVDGKPSQYNKTLSKMDKEFISEFYPGKSDLDLTAKKIRLTYKQAGDPNSYEYNAVRIGEYYWIDNNFYHMAPNHRGGTFGVGGEPQINEAMLDTYMKAIHINLDNKGKAGFPNEVYNLQNYYRYYGRHYNKSSISYMTNNGKMYIGDKASPNWELPSYKDFRQLFAMAPIVHINGTLSRYDIQTAFAAKHGDNPAASPYCYEVHNKAIKGEKPAFAGRCRDDHGNYGIHAIYFNTQTDKYGKPNTNMYGFNLMAGGVRGNNTWTWANGLYDIETGNSYHNGVGQYLYQLFYTATFYTKENSVSIDDAIQTNLGLSYHWFNARWCRKLTDAELGYKLYVNESKTDIKKLGLDVAPPAGYIELDNGYLRGFYVMYILDNPSPKYTVSDLVQLVSKVQDPTPNKY